MLVRPEEEKDEAAIRTLNEHAFETPAEANLVAALRVQARPVISLVAEDGGDIVGHIMFSPVELPSQPKLKIMGLAPMAVSPARQRTGIGSALVKAGVEACRKLGAGAVVVLGHSGYYPRFCFAPAARFGISCEYQVPEDVFMLLELKPGYLAGMSGKVKFHTAFNDA